MRHNVKEALPGGASGVRRSESSSAVSDSLWPHGLYIHEFSRPDYWSGQPFPSPGDLPSPGIEPRSPSLQVDSFPAEPQGKSSGKDPNWQCRRGKSHGFDPKVQKIPLEKGMATYSSILVWKIPWTEDPGGLQSMGSWRVTTVHGVAKR